MKKILLLAAMMALLLLSACDVTNQVLPLVNTPTAGPVNDPALTDTPAPPSEASTAVPTQADSAEQPATVAPPADSSQANFEGGYSDLVQVLKDTGVTVTEAGDIQQPFFPIVGKVVNVNGADIQVFEFQDEALRQQAADTIAKDGSQIGTTLLTWVDIPHFWSAGRVVALYLGEDKSIITLLSSVIGPELTDPTATGNSTEAGNVEEMLLRTLGVSPGDIQIVSAEQTNFPDTCLGMPQSGESCDSTPTPGWLLKVNVKGQLYEVHTDLQGSNVRYQVTQ